jgi:hypothetical protein
VRFGFQLTCSCTHNMYTFFANIWQLSTLMSYKVFLMPYQTKINFNKWP